jgi:hypothetical protein
VENLKKDMFAKYVLYILRIIIKLFLHNGARMKLRYFFTFCEKKLGPKYFDCSQFSIRCCILVLTERNLFMGKRTLTRDCIRDSIVSL